MDQFQLSLAPGKNEDYAMGGGLEGASRMSRELLSWQPRIISPADMISQDKELADLRAADAMNNQGMVRGAVETHKDSIVGSQYRLNARPNLRTLGRKEDDVWSNEFQEAIEGRFNLLGASTECWFDASRINSFTGLIRMTIAQAFGHGEALGTAEWMPAQGRPFQTAIQMIHPLRLSNPFNTADTATLKSGQEIDKYGATQFYWIRGCHPGDSTQLLENWDWKKVAARKPWGRRQVLHVFDQETPGQPRGISSIVAALKDMHMSKRFREVTLQNAVINASYAAAIESELPKEMVFQQMGGMNQVAGFTSLMDTYMQMISTFMGGAKNVRIDGSTIPVLMPGTKLNLTPIGTPGGVGTEFEVSMLRHIAATLGLSYEEFSRDWTKTNYSSARAGMSQTEKHMKARKKTFADRMASMIYRLWLEEEVDKGSVPMPAGMNRRTWYDDPTVQEALSAATWIGSGRGQIDELKETQAAALRVGKNFSTDEAEAAKLGEDWREIYAQRAREEKEKQRLGLPNLIDDLEAQRAGVQAANDAKKQAKADANQPTGNEKPAKAEHDDAEDQLEQIQGDLE